MIRTASNHLQPRCYQQLTDAISRIRSLPKTVLDNDRVVVICSRDTARDAVLDVETSASTYADNELVDAVVHALRVPRGMRVDSFQRVRAGSTSTVILGTLNAQQASVTGSLAMLLQAYGLRRNQAIDLDKSVAAGATLVFVACAGLPAKVCKEVYETMNVDSDNMP